ncbi:MAG: type II toxin-antitoxin system RelE/ParE family toxin [Ruminococcus sp.]
MYKLEFLPSALRDMTDIAYYIGHKLSNPSAAKNLADEMIQTAEKTAGFPYSYPLCIPVKPLKYEYRKIIVHNYIMFYYVDENAKSVTIARVIYGKSNYNHNLK